MNAKKVYALAKKIEKIDAELSRVEEQLIIFRTAKIKLEQRLMAEISGNDEDEPTDEET
jgi:hypothetical protein